MERQCQISLEPLQGSLQQPYQNIPSRAILSRESSVRHRTPRSKKTRNARRQKEYKRTFDRLAEIYLQNPHFLKREQLESILEMNHKPKNQHSVAESAQNEERPLKIQERIEQQLERRKIQGSFRISAKHFVRSSTNYNKHMDRTIQLPCASDNEPQRTNHHELIQIRKPIPSPNLFDKRKLPSNSTADPSISAASHHEPHFRRYRYQRKNSEEAVKLLSNIKRPTTQQNSRQKSVNHLLTFIFNSKDEHMRRQLEKHGWRENKILDSNVYALKWSYKDDPEDYRIQQQPSCIQKFFNHIKYNDMTSKAGLIRLFRNLCEAGVKPSTYMPRTHDLTEDTEIAADYYFTAVQSILKKHIIYFQNKIPKQVAIMKKMIKRKQQKSIIEESLEEFFSNCLGLTHKDENFVVNMPLIKQTLTVIEINIRIMEGSSDLNSSFLSLLQDQKVMKTLLKFSKINPPYEELAKIGRSNLNEQFAKSDKLPDSPRKSSWWTPPTDLVYRCLYYHEYLLKKLPSYKIDGLNNIWIVKPCSSSRGQGIYLTDKLQSVLQSRGRGRLAQKYIEQTWILGEKQISHLSEQSKEEFRSYPLFGRKFDLRQWVLISSVNPLEVYIFSEFYLKICPQKYDCKQLGSLSKHLSNFSVNKSVFRDPSTSILSEPQFNKILQKLGYSTKPLKKKIRQIVIQMVKVGSQSMEHILGTFELVGFDILLDSVLNPWVLEVNMSPACSQRAEWVSTMLEQMTRKTLSIVLPEKLYKPTDELLDPNRFNWEKIISEEKFIPQKFDRLQVVAARFNTNLEKRRQKLFIPVVESKICQLQRCIRKFLRRTQIQQQI